MAKVSLRAYNREIEAMIDRGQLDEAIAHCRHILKTYPKHLETYRLLGKAYLEYKRYGDAVDIFSRILVSVPNDFVAQVGMSIIRDDENRLDDAIWHMERAFETQPSNPAIQAELQRLYARRDGVRPPRIRMTRGALANMYVQGELYPQAISEIKSVLNEDAGRADMQALLARACYRSGLKNEAADVAAALLRRYPYSFDGNRVMIEILGAEHPESMQIYRQRVYELDPYAAHVTGNVFLSNDVSDAAVNIERLDWNGQPVSMQPDWGESRAIGLEGESPSEQRPDWFDMQTEEEPRRDDILPTSSQPTPPPIFESSAPFEQPAQPADDIPDFLREAGWGRSTGAFDESQSSMAEEGGPAADSLEQGDLPDWIKAMKPVEAEPPARQENDELPDWITNIGAGALASQASDQPDWLKQEEPADEPAPAADEQPDWMKQIPAETQSTPAGELSGDLDWLDELGETQPTSAVDKTDDLDWIKNLGETGTVPSTQEIEDVDWMKDLGSTGPESSAEPSQEPDWLKGIGEPETTGPAAQATEDPDWMKDLGMTEQQPSAEPSQEPDWLKGIGEPESTSTAGQPTDDLDWMKNLGAPEQVPPVEPSQEPDWLKGIGEPEATMPAAQDETPDWLKELSGETSAAAPSSEEETPDWLGELAAEEPAPAASASTESDFLSQLSEEPILPTPQETPSEPTLSTLDVDKLGVSDQERDDSFAWLESLAAKQGATEGLLTKPEERREEEPEWVKQAKGMKSETPASPPPVEQPAASLEDLGKSEQDQDDSFAWLENLAARQGATEGLLTKPEERREEEPEWVRRARDLNAQETQETVLPEPELDQMASMAEPGPEIEQPAVSEETMAELQTPEQEEMPSEPARAALESQMEQPAALSEPEPVAEQEQPESVDEIEAWLKNLGGEETPAEPVSAADETAMWLRGLEEREPPVEEKPIESTETELPAWMKDIAEEPTPTAQAPAAMKEPALESTWMPPVEEAASTPEEKPEEDALPSWLSELDQEEEQIATATEGDDLPAWLRAEEAAPSAAEPTLASDWRHAESAQPEDEMPEAETTESALPPSEPFDLPLEEPAHLEAEPESEPAAEPEPVMEAPTSVPEPEMQPVAKQETGELHIPSVDPVLETARNELSGNNVSGALETYEKLIKKARYLDEVIYDLREASYRYPVDVSIWQSLGDAYMRANRLQDALDAYTKAEELLR